jgi:hypothetical protein
MNLYDIRYIFIKLIKGAYPWAILMFWPMKSTPLISNDTDNTLNVRNSGTFS